MERKEVDDQPTGRSIEKKNLLLHTKMKKVAIKRIRRMVILWKIRCFFSASFFSDWYCDAGDDISLSMIVYQRIWVCSLRWYHTLYVQ